MSRRLAVAVARVEQVALRMIERQPGARENVFAHGAHQAHVKMNIVETEQLPSCGLVHALQMKQIRDGISLARVAVAGRVDRSLHAAIGSAPQIAPSQAGECHALLGERSRQNAVEHIDSAVYRFEQIAGGPHAHQISRAILRQQLGHGGGAVFALRTALAHRKSADGVAVEGHLGDGSSAFDAKIGVTGPLHNPEQRLRRVAASRQAALRPAVRDLHRAAGDSVLDRRGHALIEHHHDVGADCLLSLDAALGTQTNQGVVHIAGKFGVILVQRAASGKRKYLIAAGIRQYRPRPIHEAVDAAEFFEDLDARPQ